MANQGAENYLRIDTPERDIFSQDDIFYCVYEGDGHYYVEKYIQEDDSDVVKRAGKFVKQIDRQAYERIMEIRFLLLLLYI